MRTDWSTPESLKAQVEKLWNQGRILSARLCGEPLFPFRLRLQGPRPAEWGTRFEEARLWIQRLEQGSSSGRSLGYELEWAELNHRQLGRNRVPVGALILSEEEALRWIQKTREARRFQDAVDRTCEIYPALESYFAERPVRVLENLEVWDRLVAVVAWFLQHPRPGIYLRQLEIPGVDTKLVEAHRSLLCELLDRALPPEAIDSVAIGAGSFERRYGLRCEAASIRFRILDPRLAVNGFTDLSVPAEELAAAPLPVKRVFITENKVNGLAFPRFPESLVVFGLGYGLERLGEVPWLQEREIFYWGDIDTHGFAILDRLRRIFPRARSFLMDRATLLAHRDLWGCEAPHQRHLVPLQRLTADEGELFSALCRDVLGPGVRLEQERVSFQRLRETLEGL